MFRHTFRDIVQHLGCTFDVDLSPPRKVFDFVTLQQFLATAKSSAEELQQRLLNVTNAQLENVEGNVKVHMTGLLQSLFNSLFPEKGGALLLLVIGLVIAAFSFIAGFLCLIIRFICSTLSTCTRKGSSIICGPCLYLLLLVCSFSFILTGLVVHNQSASMRSYSVDNVHLYRSDILRKLLGVWKKGIDAIACAVDGTVGKISEPQVLRGTAGVETFGENGTFIFSDAIYTELYHSLQLESKVVKSRKQCKIIHHHIKILETKRISNRECTVALNIARNTVAVVEERLRGIEPAQPGLSTTSTAVRQAWANVLDKVAGRESKFEAFFKKINLIDTAIADEIKAVRSWNGYSMPTKQVDPAPVVPGAFVLLLMFLITMILSMRLFYRRSETYYLDIWRIATICQPLFEDKNYSVEVLMRCREQQTIFQAVGVDTAVNSTELVEEVAWPIVKQKTEELSNAVLQQTFKSQTMQMEQLVNSSEIKGKLKSCETTDPHTVRKIAEEFNSLSRSLVNIRDDVEKVAKNSSSEMKGELSTNVFSCSGLHAAYENVGKILCENASSPIQNLLKSAGLAGSWFAPASVVAVLSGLHGMCSVSNLLCIYLHYRFTKRRRRKKQKADDDSSKSLETI